jgi:hypothetical protein
MELSRHACTTEYQFRLARLIILLYIYIFLGDTKYSMLGE